MTYPRERTRSSVHTNTYTRLVYWPSAGVPTGHVQVDAGSLGTDEFVGDTVTRQFQKVRRVGGIVNSPFERTVRTYGPNALKGFRARANAPWTPGGTDYYEVDHDGAHLTTAAGNLSPAYVIDQSSRDRVRDVCTTRAISKIVKPELAGMVSAAEMHQTLAMLRNPLKFLSKLTKVSGSRARAVTEAGSDAYLQYRYGIRPLMADVENCVNLLSKVYTERYTARAEERLQSTTSTNSSTVINGNTYWYTDTHSHTLTYRVGTLYECQVSLSDSMGFSIQEIPSLAWEVIPYSFIADWFANVGDYIQAITPKADVRTLANWTVCEDVINSSRQITGTTFTTAGWTLVRAGSGSEQGMFKRVTRSPIIAAPSISFRPEPLRFASDLRLLDSLALIEQNVRRLK